MLRKSIVLNMSPPVLPLELDKGSLMGYSLILEYGGDQVLMQAHKALASGSHGKCVCALGRSEVRIRLLSLKFGFVASWEYRKLSLRSRSHHVRVKSSLHDERKPYRLPHSMASNTQLHDLGPHVHWDSSSLSDLSRVYSKKRILLFGGNA